MYSSHFIAPSLTRGCNEEPIFAQPLKYAFYVDTVMLSCPVFHGLVRVEQVYSLQSVSRQTNRTAKRRLYKLKQRLPLAQPTT